MLPSLPRTSYRAVTGRTPTSYRAFLVRNSYLVPRRYWSYSYLVPRSTGSRALAIILPYRNQPDQGERVSSFGTYIIGFIVLIVGLAIAAYLLGVPTTWIAVGVIVLIGIGILSGTSRTKTKDPPSST
jgi:uncharacterized membrane protein